VHLSSVRVKIDFQAFAQLRGLADHHALLYQYAIRIAVPTINNNFSISFIKTKQSHRQQKNLMGFLYSVLPP